MMHILVTGAQGFVGRHVTRELAAHGHAPLLVDQTADPAGDQENAFTCDLRDADALKRLVADHRPDACIHLAGIAFVPLGWSDPRLVFSVNVSGTLNLLESFRQGASEARVLVVTSAEVYGREPASHPLTESSPPRPSNLYAVSKTAADLSALLYARRYQLPVMTARPQNHIGPGQSTNFVAQAFADQLARIRAGRHEPVIHVGNLECRRDFTDVRDVARAYRLLIEQGTPGEAYNIAQGNAVRIGDILDHLCREAGLKPEIKVDDELYRETDDLPLLDTAKIHAHVGWAPRIALDQTLHDVYMDVASQASAPP